jgi:predicted RNA-binding protein with PUA-like domain
MEQKMQYWLMKSEPECYSIDDLKKDKITPWDGVRNYQARNMLRDQVKKGDQVLFYHSNCQPPGIVGTAEVVKESYPDHTAFDPNDKHYDPKSHADNPRWFMVDVKFKQKFPRIISLDELRQVPELNDMLILRKGNRLSVTPVTVKEWQVIHQCL